MHQQTCRPHFIDIAVLLLMMISQPSHSSQHPFLTDDEDIIKNCNIIRAKDMTSQYYNSSAPPMVPVAVPFGDTRPSLALANMTHNKSNYKLPSSQRNGAVAPVPEEQIQQLTNQGYTRGLANSLSNTIKNFPLRIWVVDNSGSMRNTDGHRFVETKRSQDVKVVNCSRCGVKSEIVSSIMPKWQHRSWLQRPFVC